MCCFRLTVPRQQRALLSWLAILTKTEKPAKFKGQNLALLDEAGVEAATARAGLSVAGRGGLGGVEGRRQVAGQAVGGAETPRAA